MSYENFYSGFVSSGGLAYRRPVLQFGSTTTVAVESGLDGTANNVPILFPDGTFRTETSTTRTTFNITRNAVLTTSGAQSGLRTSLSEATNTWYALYAVKVTDSNTLWCTVGDTRLPLQANYANLNTAFGTRGWVYLGLIRNGDNSGATGDILSFVQAGNHTIFTNQNADNIASDVSGTRLATTASATSLTYTYSAGTGTTDIPGNILMADIGFVINSGSGTATGTNAAANQHFYVGNGAVIQVHRVSLPVTGGLRTSNTSSTAQRIILVGFTDGVLGVGANPLL